MVDARKARRWNSLRRGGFSVVTADYIEGSGSEDFYGFGRLLSENGFGTYIVGRRDEEVNCIAVIVYKYKGVRFL